MKRYALIVSGHRSGSTVLNLVLGSHARTASVGEFAKLSTVITEARMCTCGDEPFTECPFWMKVSEELKRESGWSLFEDIREHPVDTVHLSRFRKRLFQLAQYISATSGLPFVSNLAPICCGSKGVADEMARNTFEVFDAVLNTAGTDVVIDATKDPFRAQLLFSRRPGACRIIYLTRDGRGVLCSMLGKSGGPAWNDTALAATRRWVQQNRRIRKVLLTVPGDRQIQVRYEDLCSRTDNVLRDLCALLGIGYEEAMQQFGEVAHHDVGGNRMRFQKRGRLQIDELWRSGLSVDDLAVFERVGGRLNRDLGYRD